MDGVQYLTFTLPAQKPNSNLVFMQIIYDGLKATVVMDQKTYDAIVAKGLNSKKFFEQ